MTLFGSQYLHGRDTTVKLSTPNENSGLYPATNIHVHHLACESLVYFGEESTLTVTDIVGT